MADDRPPRTGTAQTGAASAGAQRQRDPRLAVAVPFRYKYQSILDFQEVQAVNISRSGMFVVSNEPLPVGSVLEFEFALADGFPLLRGKAEVVRLSTKPPGMGLRFQQLDDTSRKLIDRIVEVNTQEGKRPTVSLDFLDAQQVAQLRGLTGATGIAPGVDFRDRDLRIEINPGTASYFTNNPLLNIRLGGFVVPGPEDISLGTIYGVVIVDVTGAIFFDGKGKVVAKHEHRLGIRLSDVPKDVLGRLQAEINKVAPANK